MWFEILKVGLGAIRAHKFRAALTVLSITIGAFSIVLMASLAASGIATLSRGIEEVGGARMVAFFSKAPEKAERKQASYSRGLTLADLEALRERIPHARFLDMHREQGEREMRADDGRRKRGDLVAGTQDFLGAFTIELAAGRNLDAADLEGRRRVAVVGDGLASVLFASPEEALGKIVRADAESYRVVGVASKVKRFGVDFGFDWNDFLLVPMTPAADGGASGGNLLIVTEGAAFNDIVKRIAGAILQDAQVTSMRESMQTISWKGTRRAAVVVGAPPEALAIYRLKLARGRFITAEDARERRKVAVIGHKLWEELFEGATTLEGLEVKTSRDRFVVVGVLEHKPSMGGGGPWRWDARVILPEPTFRLAMAARSGGLYRDVDRVFVRLAAAEYLAARIDQVRGIARSTVKRRHYGVENFRISGEGQGDAKGELIIGIISLLILTTAVISLVVGGINVMNIMLVSVTERTREVGIRRAVGAPRSHVMIQFLAEAVVTAGLGGLVGVAWGVALTAAAAAVLGQVLGDWSFHIAPWAPPLALGSALLVGAVFGLFPAWKASRLDPVEALRFE